MRNTKAIDPSLSKKIKENDDKLKVLYEKEYKMTAGLRKSNTGRNKSYEKPPKKKNNNDESFSDVIIKTYNDVEPSPQTEEINSKMSKTLENEKRGPSVNHPSRMEKRKKFKKNKEEKKNNTTINVNNNSDNKPKKTYNKEQVDEMVNRLYTNDYKHRKPAYTEEEYKKNTENEPDIEEFIERVEEDKKKRNERLENKKKELEKNEKEIYTYKPKMSKGSKKYNESKKENFLERQKNYNEKKAQKEEKLKEALKKQQEDEIKENNFLLKKRHDKKKEETKESSEKKNNKEEVDKTINDLFEWEEKRKKKIEDKQKEESQKIETANDYVPKINIKSQRLAEKNKLKIKEPNVFNRLAEHDKILKEKKKILIDMYTPSFQPRSYVPRNMNLDKIKKKGNYMGTKDNQNEEEEE